MARVKPDPGPRAPRHRGRREGNARMAKNSFSVVRGSRTTTFKSGLDDAEARTGPFELQDGTRFRLDQRLDLADAGVLRRLIEGSEELGRPLFVERRTLDEEVASAVLLAKRRRIVSVGEERDRMVPLAFEVSHARTFIDLDSPAGAEMLATAHDALAKHLPVDFVVRAANAEVSALAVATRFSPDLSDSPALATAPSSGTKSFPLSGTELAQAFEICAGLEYIPFAYPGDCCAYRAWEMRRVLNEAGFDCGKLFLYPDDDDALKVSTQNHPDGHVCWTYHVAPIVHVKVGAAIEPHVIDPSLFDGPVTHRQWVDRQPSRNGSRRSHKETAGDVFWRRRGASADDVDRSPIEGRRKPGDLAVEAKAVKTEFMIHYGEKIDLHMRTGPYKRGC